MFQKGPEECCMLSVFKKFRNELTSLNHVVFYNPNFTLVRSAKKIV